MVRLDVGRVRPPGGAMTHLEGRQGSVGAPGRDWTQASRLGKSTWNIEGRGEEGRG